MGKEENSEKSQSPSFVEEIKKGNIYVRRKGEKVHFYKIVDGGPSWGWNYDKIIFDGKKLDKTERYKYEHWAAPGHSYFIHKDNIEGFLAKRKNIENSGEEYSDVIALVMLLEGELNV